MKLASLAIALLVLPLLAPMTTGLPPPSLGAGPILAITTTGDPVPAALIAAGYAPCDPIAPTPDCFDVVDASLFATASLSDRTLLFVGTHTVPGPVYDALVARAADIDLFVNAGGSLISLAEPDAADVAFEFVPNDAAWPFYMFNTTPQDTATITSYGSTHPAIAGVTDAQLSGWGPSWARAIGERPNYMFPLIDGIFDMPGDPFDGFQMAITLAGNYGTGCVLISQLQADIVAAGPHTRSADAADFLRAIVDWALDCDTVPLFPFPYAGFIRIQSTNGGPVTREFSSNLDCSGVTLTAQGYEVSCTPNIAPPPSVEWVCFGQTVAAGYVGITSLRGTSACGGVAAASCNANQGFLSLIHI